MNRTEPGVLGVCSWSLQPEDPRDLAAKVHATGLRHLQLALTPLQQKRWDVPETLADLRDAGLTVCSAMMAMKGEDYSTLESIRATGGVRPGPHWPENLAAATETAAIARRFGLDLVTVHAGFLPHSRHDPERRVMIERLRCLIDAFGAEGVRVGLETGQEEAGTLLEVLDELDRPTAGINFDPANMILYAKGDPLEALRLLAPRVLQIHVKDAIPTAVPGTWGQEVPAGTGAVDWPAFMALVRSRLPSVGLMIEREAGGDRLGDIRAARRLIEGLRS